MNHKAWFAGGIVGTAAIVVLSLAFPTASVVIMVAAAGAALMLLARKRVRSRVVEQVAEPRLNLAVALFPLFVSIRQSAEVTIGLLGILIILVMMSKANTSDKPHLLPIALLSVSAAVVFRATLGAPLVILALAIVFLVLAATRVSREVALKSLGVGIGGYLIGNVVGHFANVPSPLDASRIGGFQTSTSIFAERVAFPFARSINEPGVIAAAYFGFIAATWISGRRISRFHLVGLAAAGYVMVGSNSRFPLIAAALLALATLLTPVLTRRLALPLVIVAGALPFYQAFATPLIRFGAETIASVSYLARGQSIEEIVGLGTRGTIWTGSVGFWNTYLSSEQQLLGFGPNGHSVSGANASYLTGLGGFLADRINLTTHNSFLQQLYDGGLVGLALLAIGLLIALRRYSSNMALLPQLVTVTVLAVGAATEIVLAPGATQTPFFLLLAFAAFSPTIGKVRPAVQTQEAVGDSPARSKVPVT